MFETPWDPRSSQTLKDRGCRNICLAMATGGIRCDTYSHGSLLGVSVLAS